VAFHLAGAPRHLASTAAAAARLWSDSDSGGSEAILDRMLSRPRSRPLSNFIEPCLPRRADKPPAGRDWIHEIKHDGFRIMARRDAAGVRLLTRNGHDFARRFPLAAAAVAALPARSCLIDGEAIVTDRNGLAVFALIRGHRPTAAVLCAFDLIELDGEDLRREPIETRKSTLRSLLRGKHAGIAFNAHFIADGAIVYRQACALGCEGIVSKRLGSLYRSGRADCWLKVKNPAAPAVTREAEEEWN
jgi:bifunctional non-homologous end joining protein LigD